MKCIYGTFQKDTGKDDCEQCTANFFCDALGLEAAKPHTDKPGYDCSVSGTMDPRICEMGWYSDQADGGKCKKCKVNEFCKFHAVTAGEKCPDGYNCVQNTPTIGPNWISTEKSDYHLCDKGHFCDDANDGSAR